MSILRKVHVAAFFMIGTGLLLDSAHGQDCPVSPPSDAECLWNSDFTKGTKIIDEPGKYKLCEDIVFNPNAPTGNSLSDGAFDPDYDLYDKNNYGLGFFAAIAISAPNVEIYLNCHTIEQSAGHALMQRFFAIFELANSPFLPNVGPANFVGEGSPFASASNVVIQGPGIIGRSSHHGIHGNENSNITIQDVVFKDFEVAAVSLNNVDDLTIEGCTIPHNRQNVPVLGSFSAATQIRPYGKKLAELGYGMDIKGEWTSAEELYANLVTSIDNVWDDVITHGFIDQANHPDEYNLFNNEFKVVDGPCYAFVAHGKGPAVGGFGVALANDDATTSSNILIKNNTIQNIKCWTNEIPAAVVNGTVVNDARGAILQFVKAIDNSPLAIDEDGKYKRNVVADMQIMTAKAILDGTLEDSPELQTGSNTVGSTLIDWASASETSPEAVFTPSYRCNGDSMHHVSKGMTIVRVEDTHGFEIKDNVIANVENLSVAPFGTTFGTCTDFHAGSSVENALVRQGGNVRAISVAAVTGFDQTPKKSSSIMSNTITNIDSPNANLVIGIDIQGESSQIDVDENIVDLADGVGKNIFDKYIALRCREFANKSRGRNAIDIGDNNDFVQEEQLLNGRRKLRMDTHNFLEAHKNMNGDVKTEWDMGGCPFARARPAGPL